MLKASVQGKDGRHLLVIGLTFANLDYLRRTPGDGFIKVDGRPLGIDVDIMIFSGNNEAALADIITKADGIGPSTRVVIDPKLKS